MKKLIIIAAALFLVSCKKEKICNCGLMTMDYNYNNMLIRNDCSGNEKIFHITPRNMYEIIAVGERYCIDSVNNW